jgi:preprotein translocase subunit SecG
VLPALLAALTTAAPVAAKAAAPAAKAAVPGAKATTLPLTLPPNFQFDLTPHSPLAQHAPWLTHAFAGLFVLFGVLLVILLAIQTTKQEGLSGTLGGRVESSTRRLGLDQQIARVTQFVAIAFVVVATLVSISGI